MANLILKGRERTVRMQKDIITKSVKMLKEVCTEIKSARKNV